MDQSPGPSAKKGGSSPESRKAEKEARLPAARTLARFLHEAQAAVRLKGMVSVLLTTDKKIKTLNRDFRRKNKATDVLSFPAAEISRGEVAGDLAISVDTALRQGREHGHALRVELKVLMLHGLLHLAGFDHETDGGEMARKERTLRARLKLPLGLIERMDRGSSPPTLPPEKRRPAPLGRTKAKGSPSKAANERRTA
ncbi:MAG TPA: rRNA maturation RNase YbeY [Terracidiphilus sp.]